jgi:hypothetical protein
MVFSIALRGDMGRWGLEELNEAAVEGARGDARGEKGVVGWVVASMLSMRGMEEA